MGVIGGRCRWCTLRMTLQCEASYEARIKAAIALGYDTDTTGLELFQ
jgi:hypothetical protein